MDRGPEVKGSWVRRGHPKKPDCVSGSSRWGWSGEAEGGEAAGSDREGTVAQLQGVHKESSFQLVEKAGRLKREVRGSGEDLRLLSSRPCIRCRCQHVLCDLGLGIPL